ncbi:MAG: hypothetical protein AAFQ07_00245 [Chloroflexota bacterium]
MTVAELLKQAESLSLEERSELIQKLQSLQAKPDKREDHWGAKLKDVLQDVGQLDMRYPDIEDPVAWVERLRADQRVNRATDGDEA